MPTAKLMLLPAASVVVILLCQTIIREAGAVPEGSPKGPNYCKPPAELKCTNPKVNNKHVFCDCNKKRQCKTFSAPNMTAYRQFVLDSHNQVRDFIATNTEQEQTAYGRRIVPAADMLAMSYNYVMEDAALCNAKRCKQALKSDGCHATPLYKEFGGGGQNLAQLNREALRCKFGGQPVRGCDVNKFNKYEALAYCAIYGWYFEFRHLGNVSIYEEKYMPVPPRIKTWDGMTQVLWAKSDQVGCGATADYIDMFYWVGCNYWPAGNIPYQKVYTVGPAGSKCPADKPAGQIPRFKGLCGKSELPPAPLDDFFFSLMPSPAPKTSPITGSCWPFLIGTLCTYVIVV